MNSVTDTTLRSVRIIRGYDLLLPGPKGEVDAEWLVLDYDALIEVRRSPGG